MTPSIAASTSSGQPAATRRRGALSLPLEVSAGLTISLMMVVRISLGLATQNARAMMVHVLAGVLAALCPVAYFVAPRAAWRRARAPLMTITRVGIAVVLTLQYDLPTAQPGASWLSFSSTFLVYSSALPTCFVAAMFHVPLRLHLLLAVLQLGVGLPKALSRCVEPAGSMPAPPSSLLAHFPAYRFQAIAAALDWPFRAVAPAAWLEAGRMSPAAACLAVSLLAQLALGLILPAVILWTTARGRGRRSEVPWMDEWLGERPWWMAAYTAQFAWLLLRTSVAYTLPAE